MGKDHALSPLSVPPCLTVLVGTPLALPEVHVLHRKPGRLQRAQVCKAPEAVKGQDAGHMSAPFPFLPLPPTKFRFKF